MFFKNFLKKSPAECAEQMCLKAKEIGDKIIQEREAQKEMLANGTNEQIIMLALAKLLDPGFGSSSDGITSMRSGTIADELVKRVKASQEKGGETAN